MKIELNTKDKQDLEYTFGLSFCDLKVYFYFIIAMVR